MSGGRALKIEPIRRLPWRAHSQPPGACRKGRATAGTISPGIGEPSGSSIPKCCKPERTSSRAAAAAHRTRRIRGLPSTGLTKPRRRTDRCGLERWAGAAAGASRWSKRRCSQLRVTGGFNPFDFGYRLKPGEQLETPPFYAGFTNGGMGGASRILHRFERQSILPGGENAALRPVLYNSWEATEFNVSEAWPIGPCGKGEQAWRGALRHR